MAIYKKINRETGDEALRYVVFDGDSDTLEDLIVIFDFLEFSGQGTQDCSLFDYGHYVYVHHNPHNNTTYIVITDDDRDVVFTTHLSVGEALMPYYIDGEDCVQFDKSRTYTPADLEALYPSAKYDTVVAKK